MNFPLLIGGRVIASAASVAIALVALVILLQRRLKVPEPALVAAPCAIGIIALR